ncbi:hypothetical protein DE4576_05232 [Mycobacterium marinum]|nr:hypothetical protein DE4576_05232 [Mycobacterium marinum]
MCVPLGVGGDSLYLEGNYCNHIDAIDLQK